MPCLPIPTCHMLRGQAETLVATHTLRSAQEGWSSIAAHHVELWNEALKVERRSLAAYEEVS